MMPRYVGWGQMNCYFGLKIDPALCGLAPINYPTALRGRTAISLPVTQCHQTTEIAIVYENAISVSHQTLEEM